MLKIDITKHFKNEKMNFSFETKSNRVVLFGTSGCGKSTLLKMIAGLVRPESGEIYFDDQYLYSRKKSCHIPVYKRKFGYLPQAYTLFPNMTVKDNIIYGLKTGKMPFDKILFDTIIERLQIRHKLSSMPSELSGGQMQRAALARVLIIRPKLLLLDEPFSALDIPIRECLRELVVDLTEELNIPVLFVTHDVEDAFIFGKEIIVLDHGIVIEYGDMEKIYHSPEFVKTSKLLDFKNIWKIKSVEDEIIFIDKGMNIKVHSSKILNNSKYICIKPENIKLLDTQSDADNTNSYLGRIKEIHYRGRYIKVLFETLQKILLHIHLSQHDFNELDLYKGKETTVLLRENSLVICKE